MCKIMVMAGINNKNRRLALEFTKLMAKQLTPGNSDGLGYAALGSKGELFGERWLNNSDAFVNRPVHQTLSKEEGLLVDKYQGFLIPDVPPPVYNSFGVVNEDDITAVTLHTRLATSGKEFINTHPFVLGETSLIHNGVISNASDLKMIQSTCDSEAILNEYVENKVMDKPENIRKVANKLQGYYACGVFSRTKNGGNILDIFKDSRANLEAAYIVDLKTIVFSSRLSDIQAVCSQMGVEVGRTFKVSDDMLLRVDPISGDVHSTVKFKSVGYIGAKPHFRSSTFTKEDRRELRRRFERMEKQNLNSDDGPNKSEKGVSYYDVYNGDMSWDMG